MLDSLSKKAIECTDIGGRRGDMRVKAGFRKLFKEFPAYMQSRVLTYLQATADFVCALFLAASIISSVSSASSTATGTAQLPRIASRMVS